MKIKNPETLGQAFKLGCVSGVTQFFTPWVFMWRLLVKAWRTMICR